MIGCFECSCGKQLKVDTDSIASLAGYPVIIKCPSCDYTAEIAGPESWHRILGKHPSVSNLPSVKAEGRSPLVSIEERLSRLTSNYSNTMAGITELQASLTEQADIFTRKIKAGFEAAGMFSYGMDEKAASRFMESPLLSASIDRANSLVLKPSFIKLWLGIPVFRTGSYTVELVNLMTLKTYPLPDKIMRLLDVPVPHDLSRYGSKIIGSDLKRTLTVLRKFCDVDEDHTEEDPSIVIRNPYEALTHLTAVGGKYLSTNKLNQDDFDRIPIEPAKLLDVCRSQSQEIWTVDLIENSRIVATGSSVTEFYSLIGIWARDLNLTVLYICGEEESDSVARSLRMQTPVPNLKISHGRDCDAGSFSEELNRADIVAVDTSSWDGTGAERLCQFRIPSVYFSINPAFEMIRDRPFALFINGMCPHISYGTEPTLQSEREANNLMLASLSDLAEIEEIRRGVS